VARTLPTPGARHDGGTPDGALARPRSRGFCASHVAYRRAPCQDGSWVRAAHAFEQTLAQHPDHVYVARLEAKPSRRIGLSAVAERVRAAEFPHLERRQAGARRNAPLFYRVGRADPAFQFRLPYDVAPSHPLVVQRRAATAEPVSARRAALTEGPPSSPWRRRLLLRPTNTCADQGPPWSPRLLWARVRDLVSVLAATVTGR
jgi:hypothetical protein